MGAPRDARRRARRAGRAGLADVGAVTGATVPEHLARMRELMPRTPFLLPGIGAQGGDVAALAPAFAPGRAGGLVTASRSIANAHEKAGGDPGRGRPRGGRAPARGRPGRSPEAVRAAARLGVDGRSQPRAVPGAARAGGLRRRAVHGRELVAERSGGDKSTATSQRAADRDAGDEPQEGARSSADSARRYTVKPGDTPSAIAEKTGVPLEQILQLNPDLDPQTLAPGPADQAAPVTRRLRACARLLAAALHCSPRRRAARTAPRLPGIGQGARARS